MRKWWPVVFIGLVCAAALTPRRAGPPPKKPTVANRVTALPPGQEMLRPAKPAGARNATVAAAASFPGEWTPPVESARWECIVIHHSASEIGGAERFNEYHRDRGFDELGYHFVIGNGSDTVAGRVEVGPRWTAQKHGAHCKTPDEYYNQHGIGICIVGNLERHSPSAAQWKSLTKLVKFLSQKYDIPASRIYTHGEITGQTLCPGKHFDLTQLRRDVAEK